MSSNYIYLHVDGKSLGSEGVMWGPLVEIARNGPIARLTKIATCTSLISLLKAAIPVGTLKPTFSTFVSHMIV